MKNLTATNGGTVTLYAQWVPNSHTVTFVDGLTHETITQQRVNHGESVTPPAYPVHTGYTPTGWDKTASNITADTTITVNYRANNYTIKFDKNSNRATGTMPDMQMEYGQSKTLSRNAFALTARHGSIGIRRRTVAAEHIQMGSRYRISLMRTAER